MELQLGPVMACVSILLLPNRSAGKCLSIMTNITRKPLDWRAVATYITQTHCRVNTTDTQQQLCNGKPPMAPWKLRKYFIRLSIVPGLTASYDLPALFASVAVYFVTNPTVGQTLKSNAHYNTTTLLKRTQNTSVHQVFRGKISKAAFWFFIYDFISLRVVNEFPVIKGHQTAVKTKSSVHKNLLSPQINQAAALKLSCQSKNQ